VNAARELPCLPVRDLVVLPDTEPIVYVSRPTSVAAVAAAGTGGELFVVLQSNVDTLEPVRSDVHDIGTVASLLKHEPIAAGTLKLVVRGLGRARLEALVHAEGGLVARVVTLPEMRPADGEVGALVTELLEALERCRERMAELQGVLVALGMRPQSLGDLDDLASTDDPVVIAWRAAECCMGTGERLQLLGVDSVAERLARVTRAVQARTSTDTDLVARWLDDARRTAERLMCEARILDGALRSPDARRRLGALEEAATGLQRVAAEQLAKLRRGSIVPLE